MNKRHKIIYMFLILLVIIYFSCFSNDYKQLKINFRDSILINYAVRYTIFHGREYQATNWKYINLFERERCHPFFNIYVGNIYYSTDSLKALAYCSYSYPFFKNKDDLSPEKYFSGKALALIRDSINQPWQVYVLDYIMPSGWSDFISIWKILDSYYRNGIKKQEIWIRNPKTDYYELLAKKGMFIDSSGKLRYKPGLTRNEIIDLGNAIPFETEYGSYSSKFTLDDKEFWTESLVWKKGLRVPWLYTFQTDSRNIDTEQIIDYNIPYPDSIIQMYKKNRRT